MNRSSFFIPVFVLAMGVVQGAVPARAGFDFVPPVAPAPSVPSIQAPAPVDKVEIAPVDIAVQPTTPEPVDIVQPASPAVSAPAHAPEKKTAPEKSTSAVYPPRGNTAATPLKGNRTVTATELETSRRAVSEDKVIAVPATPPSPPVAPASSSEPAATPVSDLAVVDGFGNGIPVSLAIEQILPSDFTVQYNDQPDPATIVSWAGGRSWNKVLEDMLYAHGYRVMVVGKTVTIFKAGNTPRLATPVAPVAVPVAAAPVVTSVPAVAPTPESVKEDEGVVVPAPEKTAPSSEATGYQAQKVEVFSARAGENVRDVLERWSAQASVQFNWSAGDHFLLDEPAAFNATFVRAVEQILGRFRDVADRPIAELHPNAPTGPVVLNILSVSNQTLTVK